MDSKFSEWDYNKTVTDIKIFLKSFLIWNPTTIANLVHCLWQMLDYFDIDIAANFVLRLRHVVTANGGYFEEHSYLISMNFPMKDRLHYSVIYILFCNNK